MIVLLAVTLYAAAGIVIAAAFLAFGVTRVLPAPAAVTLGARIVLCVRSLGAGHQANPSHVPPQPLCSIVSWRPPDAL